MGNKPIYRTRPRSHAYNCRCDRCLQVGQQQQRAPLGAAGFFWGMWLIFAVIAGVVLGVVKGSEAIVRDWPVTLILVAVALLLAGLFWLVWWLNLRERDRRGIPRPPKRVWFPEAKARRARERALIAEARERAKRGEYL